LGLEQALATMTTAPASVLGRADIGRLSLGGRADVVVLGEDLSIQRVLVGGQDAAVNDSPIS
jgi:N-acetylglucosamine-6-phosphate deacetylase